MASYKYENLALEGGGVWGIAYAGALDELEKLGALRRLKRVAGTSAGSIAGLLLALRYGTPEIHQRLAELEYRQFLDRQSVRRLFSHYGLYKGEFALSLFQGWIAEKLGSRDASFQDLNKARGLDLRVFATNLNTKHIHEFSLAKTPDIPLALAVRASMSVPLFFTAVEVGGQLFVDGGTLFDYPFLAFGQEGASNTLGLAFASSSAVAIGDEKELEFGFDQPGQYVRRLATVITRVQAPMLALSGTMKKNTILIDTGEIGSLQFELSDAQKALLIQNGREAVRAHFERSEAGVSRKRIFRLSLRPFG